MDNNHTPTPANGNIRTPTTVSGTTRIPTYGTAMKFASGDTGEKPRNNTSNIGANAMATTRCIRPHFHHAPSCFNRPPIANRIAATAPKDSQNPPDITASGSITSTASKAIASV